MMSQKRQENRDRIRSENDCKINLKSEVEIRLLHQKSEVEIRLLHQKIDYIVHQQWQHLVQTQNLQMDLLKEIEMRIDEIRQAKK